MSPTSAAAGAPARTAGPSPQWSAGAPPLFILAEQVERQENRATLLYRI